MSDPPEADRQLILDVVEQLAEHLGSGVGDGRRVA
jgi:hypothetical protein